MPANKRKWIFHIMQNVCRAPGLNVYRKQLSCIELLRVHRTHVQLQLFKCCNIWKASAKMCKYCVFNFVFLLAYVCILSLFVCCIVFNVSFVIFHRHMYFILCEHVIEYTCTPTAKCSILGNHICTANVLNWIARKWTDLTGYHLQSGTLLQCMLEVCFSAAAAAAAI